MKQSIFHNFEPFKAILIIAVAILSAIEVLILLGIISFHIPFKPDPALADIFFHYRKGFLGERELQLYMAGVALAIAFFILGTIFLYERFSRAAFVSGTIRYILMHGVLVVLEIGFVFQLTITPTSSFWWAWLYGVLVISALIKIFYSEINRCFG